MIVGQNSSLNQFVPTFYIKDLLDGQTIRYNSTIRAFVNANPSGSGGGASKLGELENVSPTTDNPLTLSNGQALVWNSFTNFWENQFVDYTTLLNRPVTAAPANQIVFGNAGGTGYTSSANFSYNPLTDTLHTGLLSISPNNIITDVTQPLTISSSNSLTFSVNSSNKLVLNANGSFIVDGSVGTSGFVLTSQGPGLPARWQVAPSGAGTVTSISGSGGTTGLTLTGGPITTFGVLTLGGTLSIANGGTGQTTAQLARNALLPVQAGSAGRFLTTDGTNVSWAALPGSGTVTSVAIAGNNGISVISGSPINTSGTITLGLGAITPTSVAALGTIAGSNLSGTNTGDQTITLTGDVTGSGTGSIAASLSLTGVVANTYGSSTQVPVFTVNSKGRITSVTNTTITSVNAPEVVVFQYSSGGAGNFSGPSAIFSQTANVSTTITDPVNCIATYAFTGKSNPPKSITTYGQVYSLNTFTIKDTTSLPSASIAGGGTAASPDLANGIFTTGNILTMQTRMSDTGASASIGQRAFLVVVFGF